MQARWPSFPPMSRGAQSDISTNSAIGVSLRTSPPSPALRRLPAPDRDRLLAEMQAEGTCWVGPTAWRSAPACRASFCGWSTRLEDRRAIGRGSSESERSAGRPIWPGALARGSSMSMTETSEQMDARLLRVIAQAQFEVFPADYIWQPMSRDQRPSRDAIACVRDGEVWYEFVPAPTSTSAQRYRVVSFHFKEGTDAAGFVAWLAAHLKRSAGTGSVVICGKDRRETPELFRTSQDVFDYWTCSVAAGDRFVALIRSLIAQGSGGSAP